MRTLEQMTEHDMVSVFLQAEMRSERFGGRLREALRLHGVPASVVEMPDTGNAEQNAGRLAVLREYRWYGLERSLFSGFPYGDVSWSRVALSPDEVLAIRYIDDDYWPELSAGTRLPTEAARRIQEGQADPERARNFLLIAEALERGASFHEMIAVTAGSGSPLVALEGHLRLTVYALRPDRIPDPLTVVLGTSPRMVEWGCY